MRERFGLVRHRPGLWAAIMLLYPIVSVYPQGVLHRVFLFHRYGELFPKPRMKIVASALAFCWMHIIFHNWVALAVTLPGGLLFAWTYQRTRSAMLTAIEHSLYGCWAVTIGLGQFLYRS